MKTKWYYRLPVKLVALLLLFAFIVGAEVDLYGVYRCVEAGVYGQEEASFASSTLAYRLCQEYRWEVDGILNTLSQGGSLTLQDQNYLEQEKARFSAENSNLRVILEAGTADSLLPLERLLGLPERGELSDRYALIFTRAQEYPIPSAESAIGEWLHVGEASAAQAIDSPSGSADVVGYGDGSGAFGASGTRSMYDWETNWCQIKAYFYLDTKLPAPDAFLTAYHELDSLRTFAVPSLVLLAACLLLGLADWVFLMSAAGHRPGAEKDVITLRFIDRIPYDLFGCVCAGAIFLFTAFLVEMVTFHQDMPLFRFIFGAILTGMAVLFIAFTLSTAVRWKSHTLLRNTLVWRFCAWVLRGLSGGVGKLTSHLQLKERTPEEQAQLQEQRAQTFSKLGEGAQSAAGMIGSFFRAIGSAAGAFGGWLLNFWKQLGSGFSILPMVWKGVLLLAGIAAVNVFLPILAYGSFFSLLLLMLFDMWVLWGYLSILRQMVWLHQGAKKIAAGDLDYRLPTDVMHWEFKAHGEALNTIRGGIDAAVEERIRSDRMRNELLTNVSHDIKTPLTSIINYVDLLKKEDVPGEKAREYIAVLDRQSIRLKRLLEDLLEASKASTGNMTVNAAPTDVGELLRQVAGEYTEKLSMARLEPIISLPGRDAVIFADGRLLWRVFDNLMANIVKYAMPNTRVYLDLRSDAELTVVAVKNVSRERLNIDADELIERFVRGDASRATEGSGLGLSIAQSLTELMGGTFQLMIDGDLFKVQLGFPTLLEPPSEAKTTYGKDSRFEKPDREKSTVSREIFARKNTASSGEGAAAEMVGAFGVGAAPVTDAPLEKDTMPEREVEDVPEGADASEAEDVSEAVEVPEAEEAPEEEPASESTENGTEETR